MSWQIYFDVCSMYLCCYSCFLCSNEFYCKCKVHYYYNFFGGGSHTEWVCWCHHYMNCCFPNTFFDTLKAVTYWKTEKFVPTLSAARLQNCGILFFAPPIWEFLQIVHLWQNHCCLFLYGCVTGQKHCLFRWSEAWITSCRVECSWAFYSLFCKKFVLATLRDKNWWSTVIKNWEIVATTDAAFTVLKGKLHVDVCIFLFTYTPGVPLNVPNSELTTINPELLKKKELT